MSKTTRWTKHAIRDLLRSNPKAVEKAIIVLYRAQTSDEQVAKDTKHRNHRGFSSSNAFHGTRIAEVLLGGFELNSFDRDRAYRIASFHSAQLSRMANANAVAQQEREQRAAALVAA